MLWWILCDVEHLSFASRTGFYDGERVRHSNLQAAVPNNCAVVVVVTCCGSGKGIRRTDSAVLTQQFTPEPHTHCSASDPSVSQHEQSVCEGLNFGKLIVYFLNMILIVT